ncbi:hypothetical protein [Aquifex aeolicus]|uniref:hypothetical protein n=1 Tax=Aquifex aeolicus TaxID=63363 RepID=UPI00030EA64C|nr:hypothetical protein [Aquifex aeolicus]
MPAIRIQGYLTSTQVLRELKERGIEISDRTLIRYVKRGFIPGELVRIKRRGLVNYYYFKPEVVDFLVQELSV